MNWDPAYIAICGSSDGKAGYNRVASAASPLIITV
jgi:hypothetical protein